MPPSVYYNKDELLNSATSLGANHDYKNKNQPVKNSYAINYLNGVINGESEYAIKKTKIKHASNDAEEAIKQIGERKFVELQNLQCKDHGNDNELVNRYLYFDMRPDKGGLIAGLKQNIELLDPTKNSESILKNLKNTPSKSDISPPHCRQVTCEVIDENTERDTWEETNHVAYEDMLYNKLPKYCKETDPDLSPPECSYESVGDNLVSDSDLTLEERMELYKILTSSGENFTNIKTNVDTSKLPKDKMIQGYYCLLSFLGLYLIYSCSTLKPNR
jgi:hypothetical protein